MNATYSPDDNKLRLYAESRLDSATYARVKAAGFRWAPKQGLFVAPSWTPERENLLIDLCGAIDDEDISLVERQEERAERFEEYRDKRKAEAETASNDARAISERFAGGQPILVGHHSERKARKDHERMDTQLRKALSLWETSTYWQSRAIGAIRHAKYKERPDVRARRIKGIEADKRKAERYIQNAETCIRLWENKGEPLTLKQAQAISNFDHMYVEYEHKHPSGYVGPLSAWDALRTDGDHPEPKMTVEAVKGIVLEKHRANIAYQQRWLDHYHNRLVYERAMLEEAGGLPTDQAEMQIGGQVLSCGKWHIITKINPQSVSVIGHWPSTIPFDEIKDYQPPKEGDAEKVKAATKIPPICNYPGEGFKHMTKAELQADKSRKWTDAAKTRVIKGTDQYGAHRVQLTRSDTSAWDRVPVYLTDVKRKDPPPPEHIELPTRAQEPPKLARAWQPDTNREQIDQLKAAHNNIKQAQIVVGPELYPTPEWVAERMIELADIQPGHRVLEPSAGTGNLLKVLPCVRPDGEVVAVEWLASARPGLEPWADQVIIGDFLSMNGDLGQFDRIVMNPPFTNWTDIKHIDHAFGYLRPGGKLVAICANGPRQRERFHMAAEYWEDLPDGTFKDAGTMVNAAIMMLRK